MRRGRNGGNGDRTLAKKSAGGDETARDRELRHAIEGSIFGSAAIGLCIARVLIRDDPTLLEKFLDEATKLQHSLSSASAGYTEAASILSNFALALTNPEKMPLLAP